MPLDRYAGCSLSVRRLRLLCVTVLAMLCRFEQAGVGAGREDVDVHDRPSCNPLAVNFCGWLGGAKGRVALSPPGE